MKTKYGHDRPAVNQEVVDSFTDLVDQQDAKGIAKYNETIDDAKDEAYNWELMALEEAVDLTKYQVRRIKQLQRMNSHLAQMVDQQNAAGYELQQEVERLQEENKKAWKIAEENDKKYAKQYSEWVTLRDKYEGLGRLNRYLLDIDGVDIVAFATDEQLEQLKKRLRKAYDELLPGS